MRIILSDVWQVPCRVSFNSNASVHCISQEFSGVIREVPLIHLFIYSCGKVAQFFFCKAFLRYTAVARLRPRNKQQDYCRW
jgi:hypothetical protein